MDGGSEDSYIFACDCYDMAGYRLLHGYVYGQHGKRAGEFVRIGESGRGRKDTPVL